VVDGVAVKCLKCDITWRHHNLSYTCCFTSYTRCSDVKWRHCHNKPCWRYT